MHRFLTLVFGLALAFSLASGAVAHAVEGPPSSAAVYVDCGADAHTDDTDNTPDDTDAADAPTHFHGCHGHHIGVPDAHGGPLDLIDPSDIVSVDTTSPRRQSAPNQMLRPPMA